MQKNDTIFKLYQEEDKKDDETFWQYINIIREKNNEYYKKKNKKKKYLILTYGCQMNEHDSEKISWILEEMGYESTSLEEEADFIIFNTCAIRENAELKVYGKVGSLKTLKKINPDLKIAISGCMMQIDEIREEIEEKYEHVDIIFGTHNAHNLPKLYVENLKTNKTAVEVLEDELKIIEGVKPARNSSFKAYVNIMYGCNNFCTYCVVPYTRGREISRNPKNIINEVKNLIKDGYKEIMLLGQNVNSYGKTLKEDYSFVDLLKDLDKIPGLERLRFMTSHPKDISDELISAYGELNSLANHLHLPVQSGSDKILKAMNRNYSYEKYMESIKKIRKVKPDIALSTDIIVGFPGETDEDFEKTLKLIQEVKYDFVYNFIYSPRPGTKASKMENQVPYEVKHKRFERLNEEINRIMLEKNQKFLNKEVKLLIEEVSKTDDSKLSGRTEENKLVHFEGDSNLIGKIVNVLITDISTFSMEGKLI